VPYYGSQWPKYVPVAERRRKARRKMDQLRKKGMNIQPVEIEGRKIAKTFWGKAWCDHMESLGDFENRLPRGRTYVCNGSVCHLAIKKGRISAMVSGSSLYKIEVKINTLPKAKWNRIKRRCVGQIGSLIELLQGSLSAGVMEVVADRDEGLFPSDSEIHLTCDCPDWADLCKHLAAVLYGVGVRLDEQPELLFLLRGVKHDELIDGRLDEAVASTTGRGGRRRKVDSHDLGDVFGIDLEETSMVENGSEKARSAGSRKKTPKKNAKAPAKPKSRKTKKASTVKKKVVKKKAATKKKNVKKKKAVAKKKPAPPKKAKKKSTRNKAKTSKPAKITARKKSASR
jgi:uncharacterized Zn finger protein